MTLPVPTRPAPAAPWDPFRELDDLRDRFASLVRSRLAPGADRWVPSADVEETGDAWTVELELPGAARDDVDVQLDERVLTVSGEIRDRERRGLLHRRTRRVGAFHYAVTLPGEIDEEHVEAELDRGVLTVRVPKTGRSRRRRIPVSS
jgi:HSP20 family protein